MKMNLLSLTVFCLLLNINIEGQTNNYFGSSGSLNGNVWSVLPAGPYTSALNSTGGAIINFDNPATLTGATITVSGINANATVSSWIDGGTLATGGVVAPIMVGPGAVLNMFQTTSVAAGTGFNKTGAGVLVMSSGSAYPGGFTLTAGTMVVGGINVMGGNLLNLYGGILCSNATMNLSNKYPGGITMGGNVQFGDITSPALANANLTFDNNISLGMLNRTFTLGNAGTTTFGGIISNTAAGGIGFTANSNGSGLFDITNTSNSFTGPVTINGGKIRFAADGSFGNTGNIISVDGGQLRTDATFTITHPMQLGSSPNTAINVFANNLTISGIIADKTSNGSFTKTGAGILILTAANTCSGITYLSGGTLQLFRLAGNTVPVTNNIVVNSGTLQISSNQTINDITLAGGNLTVNDGVILTINGTLDYFQPASITLSGTGKIGYGPAGTLKYSGTIGKIVTAQEWPAASAPNTVICNNTGSVSLPITGTVTGSLMLNTGTFIIDAGGMLDLNGASVTVVAGSLAGNAAGGLTVRGTTGGTVTIPSAITLQNVAVSNTRTLALNGTSDLNLYGTLSIAAAAVFDNGGESQVLKGSGAPAVIIINGKFINRDQHNFTGTNGAIPGTITTTLIAGCIVEYAFTGNQLITARSDYSNIIFSGGGVKTLANACNPTGTVLITGNTIVNAGIHVFGNALTNLSMDDGRLILSGTNNPQPHMGGTYNLTGGIVQFDCNSSSGQTIRGVTYKNIEVTGLYVGNSTGNIALSSGGTFTVKTNSVFEINDQAITGVLGLQTVTVETGATFKCGNALGFHGPAVGLNSPSVRDNIENIILQPGSTVNYSRSNPPLVSGNQVITNTAAYQNLELSGTGGIKTAPIGILTIQGNFIKTATPVFAHNNGSVLLNGNSQSFAGLPYNILLLDNAGIKTLTGNASIADSIKISNLQTTPSTELSLGENYITLQSVPTKTARVGIIPNVAGVKINYGTNGRFVVERYYPARRAWRLITAPITADASKSNVFKSWQNWGAASIQSGTFVTGKNPDPLNNGLDISPLNNSSLKIFNHTSQLFQEVTDTKNQLIAATAGISDNIGFFIFIRGDRSTSNLFNPPFANSTTLRDTGKILIKNQPFVFSGPTASGYCLAGNPYASPVYASKIVAGTPGINNHVFYTYDPYLNAEQGGYIAVTYNLAGGGKWEATPPSPIGKQDSIIQSGQAFFVQRTALSATISFTEQDKWLTGNPAVFRPVGNNEPAGSGFSIRTNLYLLHTDNTTILADGTLAEFREGYKNSIDLMDAIKFNNVKEGLGLLRENKQIIVERRDLFSETDTLFFKLTNTRQRNYQFEFLPQNIDPSMSAVLEDNYTGTKTPISAVATSRVSFLVNTDPASAASNRFRIVFNKAAGALPVTFTGIHATRQNQFIAVQWTVESEINIHHYEVEKSLDGIHFDKTHQTAATGTAGTIIYKWLDENPLPGKNIFRIKSISNDGVKNHSSIAFINWEDLQKNMLVYPNPVKDGVIGLHFFDQPKGRYRIRLLNQLGQLVHAQSIRYNGVNGLINITPPKNKMTAGIGILQVTTPVNTIKTMQLNIE
ncbi:MAG: autotransporter-associated beta strand repeat-containing protein [Aquabacterium sp.]|nr:autotransporter-associated beta strand repeat-containing protein [Ferruginibacter sp.]